MNPTLELDPALTDEQLAELDRYHCDAASEVRRELSRRRAARPVFEATIHIKAGNGLARTLQLAQCTPEIWAEMNHFITGLERKEA